LLFVIARMDPKTMMPTTRPTAQHVRPIIRVSESGGVSAASARGAAAVIRTIENNMAHIGVLGSARAAKVLQGGSLPAFSRDYIMNVESAVMVMIVARALL
jgi:hypothetical protein